MRGPRSSKAQNPGDQVVVKSTDRIRIVKMKTEKQGTESETDQDQGAGTDDIAESEKGAE